MNYLKDVLFMSIVFLGFGLIMSEGEHFPVANVIGLLVSVLGLWLYRTLLDENESQDSR